MKIQIYNPKGELIYEMPNIFEGCVEKVYLMSEDSITLKFSLLNPVFFPIGSYSVWRGKKYIVTSIQTPTYNEENGGYDYEIVLDAYYMAWKLRIFKYIPEIGGKESSFNLTSNLEEQVKLLTKMVNEEGFLYNGSGFTYEIHKVDGDNLEKVKTQSYSSVNYIDALNQIAEAWDTEWWVTESVIHFGKCQDDRSTNVDFILGKNVESMSSSKSEQEYATRIYAFGSDRNLPKNWNKGDAEFHVSEVNSVKKSTESVEFSLFKTKEDIFSNYFKTKEEVISNEQFVFQQGNYVTLSFKSDSLSAQKTFTHYSNGTFPLKKGTYAERNLFFFDENNKVQNVQLKMQLTSTIKYPNLTANVEVYAMVVGNVKGASFLTIDNVPYLNVIKYNKYSFQIEQTDSKDNNKFKESTLRFPQFELTEDCSNAQIVIVVSAKCSKCDNASLLVKLSSGKDYVMRYQTNESFYKSVCNLIMNGNKITATWYSEIKSIYPQYKGSYFECKSGGVKVGSTFTTDALLTTKLPSYYFPSNKTDAEVIKALADTRLTLPSPIETEESKNGEVVEKILVFDDIYPRTESAISEVREKDQNVLDENNQATGETYTEYYIKTNAFTFDKDYKLPNIENMQVEFQTGALAGLSFDVVFDSSSTPQIQGQSADHQFFRVKRKQMDGGLWLPNKSMKPVVGNEFILVGWDVDRLQDMGLIKNAQKELRIEAEKELAKMSIDPNTYECTLFSDTAYGKKEDTIITDDVGNILTDEDGHILLTDDSGVGLHPENAWDFTLGRFVTLYNAALFKSGKRESRVMGYEKKMDIPYDSPIYTIGEKAVYSRFGEMQKQIDGNGTAINTFSYNGTQYVGQTSSGNGSVYLIKTNDIAEASDTNAYSSLRAKREFISKVEDDYSVGHIDFQKGLIAKSSNDGQGTAADGIIEYYE